MDSELLSAFQQHLNMERHAHAAYFASAIWFAERELRGFARYFRAESQSEHDHAAQFGEYLIARGQTVELHSLEAPLQTWATAEEIMKTSFLMEADVTTSLHQLYALAERASDVRTTVFLDPMIEKQIQAENEFAHLLGRVRFADNQPSAILIIDNELDEGRHQPATLQNN
jgi:ferritin